MINALRVMSIHSMLADQLVETKNKGQIREKGVAMSGTDYVPPKEKEILEKKLNEIIEEHKKIENPLEKAVYLHCNVARLQPFIDGNKRISRLLESIVMMNNNIVPVYSIKESDVLN